MGGDSLTATRALSRVAAIFELELPVGSIFKDPLLSDLALIIEESILGEIEALPEEEAREKAP